MIPPAGRRRLAMTNDAPTVYGPVDSWRLGRSLGVDLLCVNSICSFRCFYCQLGRINVNTSERAVFVPTRKVVEDLGRADWGGADCVTLSGSGEPTLAANMGEGIREVKRVTGKLDAADEKTFRRINRPFEGITLRGVVRGIKQLRAGYGGRLAVQTMLTPLNAYGPEEF